MATDPGRGWFTPGTLRWVRLRSIWALIIPFFIFARPVPEAMAVGGGLTLLALLLRAWASTYLHKNEALTTGGPYGFTRNPLYLGALLLGVGLTVAGARPTFVLLFLVFFRVVYGRTMRGEAELLEGRFGDRYRHYAAAVPLLRPRLSRYRPATDAGGAGRVFSLERYRRNREWQSGAGALVGFAILAVKMIWL